MKINNLMSRVARRLGRACRVTQRSVAPAILAGGMMFAGPACAVTLFTQDFEGLELQQPISDLEVNTGEEVWTDIGPAGWVRDNRDTPEPEIGDSSHGPEEFFGWTFMKKSWWIETTSAADDDFYGGPGQGRSLFTRGTGTIAVADSDEYDDLPPDIDGPHDATTPGLFNVFLMTPSINLTDVDPRTVQLSFDSSFRPYWTMAGLLDVSFDNGTTWNNLTRIDLSDFGGANDSTAKIDERLTFNLGAPTGATSAKIRWGLVDAGNDWWWAIDNVEVATSNLRCDLNGDGAADAADAGTMFGNWGRAGTGDCSNDGVVDAADAGILFGEWTGDPTAGEGTAAGEYHVGTGEIKVHANQVVNWYIQSTSGGLTGSPVGDLPGPGLVTDNNSRVGETALGKFAYNANLGAVAAPGLPQGDLVIYWNSDLGRPLQSAPVAYVPEPASWILGLCCVLFVCRSTRQDG